MRLILPMVLVAAALAIPLRGADSDDQAIRDLAHRFFDAYAAKDLDAVMALWSEQSPDYDSARRLATRLFAESGPIKLQSLAVAGLGVEGDAAWVRVRVELTGDDRKTGKPYPGLSHPNYVLELVRQDKQWKIRFLLEAEQWLGEQVFAARTREERLRWLDDESDLVGPELVEAMLGLGDRLAKRNQFDKASRLQDLAFQIARGLGDAGPLAECYQRRGSTLDDQQLYEEALTSYRKALPLFRQARDREGEGRMLNSIGIACEETGRYAEALQNYQDDLPIERDLGDRQGEAQTLNNIGAVYDDMGRYAEALQQYQNALQIKRDLGDRRGEAITLDNIGIVCKELGRYSEALRNYQDALPIVRDLGDRREEAHVLHNVGVVYDDTGRYAEALRNYQDSLTIKRGLGDRQGEAHTLDNIGIVYWETGRYAEALRNYQDSLQIARRLGDRQTEEGTLDNIGIVYRATGRYAEALKSYQDGLQITRDLGDREGEATVLGNIGNVDRDAGRYAEALRNYQDSLKISHDLGDQQGEAITLDNLGESYAKNRQYGEALQQLGKGLNIAAALGDVRELSNGYLILGEVHQAQKQWEPAADAYAESVRQVERLRSNTREPSLQTSLLGQQIAPFFHLAQCRLERNEPSKAFSVGEEMKARGLVDILLRGKADLRRGMSDEERKQEQSLQDRLTALGVQLEDLHSRKADADRQAAVKQDLDKARQDYEAFLRDLYLHRPELQTRRAEFAPTSPGDLGNSLFGGRRGLIVLSYLVGDEETLLFVLTAGRDGEPARLTVHRIDVAGKDLAEAVDAFREGCSDPSKGEPDADDLYRWLIAPAEELAGATQVVIVPDGVLHTLPFQALKDPDGKYLIERFAVSYAPSVTALTKMEELGAKRRKQYAGQPASILAIGVSDFGRREKPLPAAETEARTVTDAFGDGAKLLPGTQATLAKVEASWSGRRYLHFATHGRLNPDAPLYSSLVLSPDGDEGVLYARDLLDADVPAELVVMSACHTGEGRNVAGEGLLGMSWSWFAAGVPSVVASQWSVGDASTARLMKVFYARLRAGDSKAEALRQAELSLLADPSTHHPFFWAPFVLVGDDR